MANEARILTYNSIIARVFPEGTTMTERMSAQKLFLETCRDNTVATFVVPRRGYGATTMLAWVALAEELCGNNWAYVAASDALVDDFANMVNAVFPAAHYEAERPPRVGTTVIADDVRDGIPGLRYQRHYAAWIAHTERELDESLASNLTVVAP